MKRLAIVPTGLAVLLLAGCPNKSGEQEAGTVPSSQSPDTPDEPDQPDESEPPPVVDEPPAQRDSLTTAECESKGGTVVGDIGDGAIHRPDYKCPSGPPPLGTIKAEKGGPIGTEGSVCCPSSP